jgi:hypothetical protein
MKIKGLVLFGAICVCLTAAAIGQTKQTQVPIQNTGKNPGRTFTPDQVIRQFTAKESELREVFKDYSYVQETRMQVLGPANVVSGEFYQVSEFVFNDAGKRIERILKAPPSTLDQAGLIMTQEDRNALTNIQPFALAT